MDLGRLFRMFVNLGQKTLYFEEQKEIDWLGIARQQLD
jgi:hypothetical protein